MALAAALLWLPSVGFIQAQSPAEQSVPADWGYVPDGAERGDSFRLLFVTATTTDATSSDIAAYNAHAQNAANANDSLKSFKDGFTALISTSAVDARDNTATTGTGAPIYWLGGEKVADDYADLYDTDWDSVAGKTETGSDYTGLVWTGGNKAGEKSGQRYAGASEVRLGDLSDATLPLSSPQAAASGESYPIYALSPVFSVAEPEPTPTPTTEPESADPPANDAPTITAGPTIVSSPASGDTYGKGEAIVVSVTFSEAVTVTGQPRVRLAMKQRTRWAQYDHSLRDGSTLVFAYTVRANNRDEDGVSIPENGLGLNRGSIEDADGNAASLEHPALADQSGHKVDGSQEAAPANGQRRQPPNTVPPDPDRIQFQPQMPPDTTPPTYTLSKFLFEDTFTDAEMNVTPPSGTGNSGTRPLSPVLVFSEEINEGGTVIKYQVGSGPERTFTFSGQDKRFGPGECAFVFAMSDGRHYYCTFVPGPQDRGLFKVKVERFRDTSGNAGAAGSYNTNWGYTVDGRKLPAPTLALKNPGATTWPPTLTATVSKTGVRVAFFKDKVRCDAWNNNRNTAWTVTDTTAPYTVDLTGALSSDPTPASGSFHTFYARYIDGDNRESDCSAGFRYTYYGNMPQLTNFRALAGYRNIGADWSVSWLESVWDLFGTPPGPSKWEYRIVPGVGMSADSERWRTAAKLNSYRGYGRVGGLQRIATLGDHSTLLTNGMPYTVQVRVYKTNGSLGWISPALTVTPQAYSAPAPQTVPADWPLLPLWAEPGDKFRLMFVTTDKIHAMSHDVGHYNSLAQTAAARNSKLINSDGDHFGGEFRAIVSTAATDARDNTASTGRGVPIYFLGGNKVANDYADFYDGSWNPRYGNATNEMGRARYSGLIWTGSRPDGTKDPSNHVGQRSNIRYATVLIGGTLATGATDWERPHHLYALSPVLTVADGN